MAPKADVLPVAPDRDEILNKLNLALARHSVIFNSMKRPQQPPPSSKSNSTSDNANTSKPNAGFSSLASTTSKPTSTPTSANHKSQATLDAEEADFRNERAAPPNAGIGYMPAAQAAQAAASGSSAADKDLRKKILGKRAAEQKEDGRKKRSRRQDDHDSSDEDVGRSAIGRSKKVRKGKGA